MAISGLPFLVGYGICMSLVDIDTFCPWPPSRRRHPQLARSGRRARRAHDRSPRGARGPTQVKRMLGDARRRRQPGPFRDHSSTAQARVHGGALALV